MSYLSVVFTTSISFIYCILKIIILTADRSIGYSDYNRSY